MNIRLSTFISIIFLISYVSTFGQAIDQDVPISTRDQVILDDLIVDGSACIGMDCANGESFGFDTQRLKENNLRIKFDDTSNSASFPNNDWAIRINDSANGGASYFAIEDVSGGRTPFRVDAGAPQDALRVDSQGDVGIGTANPVVQLHVVKGNTPTLRLEQNGAQGFTPQTWDLGANEANFFVRDATNGSRLSFRVFPNTAQDMLTVSPLGVGIGIQTATERLHVAGNGLITGEFEVLSDLRVKTNILPISNAISTLYALNAVSYNMRLKDYPELNLPTDKQYGLIAQELEKVLPELVSGAEPNEDLEDRMMSVNYIQLIPILIKANQEQYDEISKLKSALLILNERLAKLEMKK